MIKIWGYKKFSILQTAMQNGKNKRKTSKKSYLDFLCLTPRLARSGISTSCNWLLLDCFCFSGIASGFSERCSLYQLGSFWCSPDVDDALMTITDSHSEACQSNFQYNSQYFSWTVSVTVWKVCSIGTFTKGLSPKTDQNTSIPHKVPGQ